MSVRRCSVYTQRRLQGNRYSLQAKNLFKKSHSLVTIFDLSRNERLVIEVLAIGVVFESLERRVATNFVTMTKKMTKSVPRSIFSNSH